MYSFSIVLITGALQACSAQKYLRVLSVNNIRMKLFSFSFPTFCFFGLMGKQLDSKRVFFFLS